METVWHLPHVHHVIMGEARITGKFTGFANTRNFRVCEKSHKHIRIPHETEYTFDKNFTVKITNLEKWTMDQSGQYVDK